MTHEQSAKSNGVCLATVTNTVKKYFEGGIDAVTEFKRNVNSDNARRVLDERAEARIIELACDPMPEGHSRWTIRRLEEKSKIVLDTPVSREAIRRSRKITRLRTVCILGQFCKLELVKMFIPLNFPIHLMKVP